MTLPILVQKLNILLQALPVRRYSISDIKSAVCFSAKVYLFDCYNSVSGDRLQIVTKISIPKFRHCMQEFITS
jgi:hypothetical protein